MTKKGFTLIELLAVILILSIILLIAIPAVNGLIEDSKKGAAEASAKNIVNAAETYYTEQAIKGVIVDNIDLTNSTLNYTGTHPTKGYVIFNYNKDKQIFLNFHTKPSNHYSKYNSVNSFIVSSNISIALDITVFSLKSTPATFNESSGLLLLPHFKNEI